MAKTRFCPDFVLLCGGQSQRLQSHGPRSLLRMGRETLLEKQVKEIRKKYKNADIVCVLGFECEKVYKLATSLKLRCVIDENFEFNSAYKSIIYGIRATVSDCVIVSHGDIVGFNQFRKPTISGPLVFDTDNKEEVSVRVDKFIESFSFGFPLKYQKAFFFNKEGIDFIKKMTITDYDGNKLDFELFNQLIEGGIKLKPYVGKTYEINTLKDYNEICSRT